MPKTHDEIVKEFSSQFGAGVESERVELAGAKPADETSEAHKRAPAEGEDRLLADTHLEEG